MVEDWRFLSLLPLPLRLRLGCKAALMPPSATLPVDTLNPTRALIKEKLIAFLRDEGQITVDDIDEDGPLSQLGIDSLGIASIHCKLEHVTHKRLNPHAIYALDSIDELAAYLDSFPIAT